MLLTERENGQNKNGIHHVSPIRLFLLITLLSGSVHAATAPGGQSANLQLWLKADAGTSTTIDGAALTTWSDQSGQGNNATETSNPPLYKNNDTDNINFNPTLEFDGSNDQLVTSLEALEGKSNYSLIAVGVRETHNFPGAVLGTDLSLTDFFFGYSGPISFSFLVRATNGQQLGFESERVDRFDFPALTPFLLSGINVTGREERNGSTEFFTDSSNNTFPDASQYYVGVADEDYFFHGRISEVIAYDTNLSSAEENRVLSYLAIKYGISLGKNESRQDYLSSAGTVVWDASEIGTSYDEDIAGIGKDDGSGLHQTRSKSGNADAILSIAENGGGMANGEFLFWSNNGASTTLNTSDLPPNIDYRLPREWVIEETGDVGNVDVSFDLSNLTLPNNTSILRGFYLLTDADGTFASGSALFHATSLINNVVTFSNLDASILNDGTFFTLGIVESVAPGGITSGIQLWLDAGAGTSTTTDGSTLTTWNDQSGSGHHATEATNPPQFRNHTDTNINFNPSVAFDGVDDFLEASSVGLDGASGGSLFSVGVRSDAERNLVLSSKLFPQVFAFGFPDGTTLRYKLSRTPPPSAVVPAHNAPEISPFLISGFDDVVRQERDGDSVSNRELTASFQDYGGLYIGRIESDFYHGQLSEILLYSRDLSSNELRKINSYFAIKYGVMLGQNLAAQDYFSSTGTVIWDASEVGNSFDEEIAAIGSDYNSGLNQTQSRSANSDAIITMASNGIGLDHNEFLFWSNNGASTTFSATDLPAGIAYRLLRTWVIKETGEVGSVDVSVDISGLVFPEGRPKLAAFQLLTDADGTFNSGASARQASSLINNIVTFSAVDESTLNDGVFFTLGIVDLPAPGGRNANLAFWFKADAGTSSSSNGGTVATWSDQGANGLDATAPGGRHPIFRDNSTDRINFNPTLEFDGISDQFDFSLNSLEGKTGFTYFAVGERTDGNNNPIVGSNQSRLVFNFGFFVDEALSFSINRVGTNPVANIPAHDDPAVSPYLAMGYDSTAQQDRDGVSITKSGNNTAMANGFSYYIGRSENNFYRGKISEIIAYDTTLDSGDRAKIRSYLAIKYGLSLGQNLSAQDYVNSSGTVIWDASVVGPNFDEDITGIGQDDDTALDQTQSRNANPNAIITIGENGGGISNGEFLFWSHNGASTTFDTTDLPAGMGYRLPRTWVVEETGEVGSLNVSFDLSTLSFPEGVPDLSAFHLLTDADGTFETGSTALAASSLNNNVVTFTAVNESTLNDGIFFTLGVVDVPSPGGINPNVTLWLKADTGVFKDAGTTAASHLDAVQEWHDQSGNNQDFSEALFPRRPRLIEGSNNAAFNFHPTLHFESSRLFRSTLLNSDSDASVFAVLRSDNISNDNLILSFGTYTPALLIDNGADDGNPNLRVRMDGSTPNLADHTSVFPASQTSLVGVGLSNGVDQTIDLRLNGLLSQVADYDIDRNIRPTTFIGSSPSYGDPLIGDLAELIVYDSRMTDSGQLNRIESYLAIKYGITLEQSTPRDYIDSLGNIIWNGTTVASGYHHDIVAIGQDDRSGLDQNRSHSVNSDTIVTITENGAGMTDREFLFWSNNNGANLFSNVDVPTGINQRLTREWVVKETGEVGSIDLSFDLSDSSLPAGISVASEFFLLTDDDGTFSAGANAIEATSFTNGVVTFTGLSENTLDDGQFFTLGITDFTGPAGVHHGIELWLKSDAGVFRDAGTTAANAGDTVQEWHDQSGNENDVSQPNSGQRPNLNAGNLNENFNFNPTVSFTSGSLTRGSLLYSDADGTVFAVVRSTNLANDNLIIEFGGNNPEIKLDATLPGFQIHHASSIPNLHTHQSPSISANTTHLTGARWTNGNNEAVATRINGIQESLNNFDINSNVGARIDIGANSTGAERLTGELAELIVYSKNLSTDSELNRIESYLATKYGIHLDQTTPRDYLNSAGNVIWDASAVGTTFNNDIAGIGQDDATSLDQSSSKSVNADAIVTITENGGEISDGEFLFWSNNNGSTVLNTTDTPATIDYRLPRTWVLEETGEVGTVNVTFDISGMTFPKGTPTLLEFFLLTDATGLFAAGSTQTPASSFSNNVVTFTGVSATTFQDGIFFTLGIVDNPGPGGLDSNLALWLKADAGAFLDTGTIPTPPGLHVREWHDQSGQNNDFGEPMVIRRPTLVDGTTNDSFNFNPSLRFNADRLFSATLLDASDDASFFAVLRSDNLSGDNLIINFGSNDPSFVLDNGADVGNPKLRFKMDGSSPSQADHTATLKTGTTYLAGATFNNGGNQTIDLRLDGDVTQATNFDINGNLSPVTFLGSASSFVDPLIGDLAEIIVYDSRIASSGELDRVESYLAIKYGITLNQSTARNYVDSSGRAVWDATQVGTSRNNNIAAIGQDDGSALNQTKSKSVNRDAIVTIAESGNGMTDGTFLFWSNDGADRTFQTTDVPQGISQRLTRTWVVEETGEVGSVDISFDLTGLPFPSGAKTPNEFFLLTDADGNFSDSANTLAASAFAGNIVTFTGIDQDLLDDSRFFTIGVNDLAGPGNVFANLELWLRSDNGTSTTTDGGSLTQWNDQSAQSNHATGSNNNPVFRDNPTDTINFNPTIEFDGTNDHLNTSLEGLEGNTNYSLFAVTIREDDKTNYILGSNQSIFNFKLGYAGSSGFSFVATDLINQQSTGASLAAYDSPALTPSILTGINQTVKELRNGETKTFTSSSNGTFPDADTYHIGHLDTHYFNGRMGEIIAFSQALSSTDEQKVLSYLAIKYGVSLGQNESVHNYIDSGGNVIWNATTVGTTFDEDITAIGQDVGSALNQSQSRSGNSDAIVTIGENGSGMTDGEFLFWSNDGGAPVFSASDVPAGVDSRLSRRWLVKETGEVGRLNLSFDTSNLPIAGPTPVASNFVLLTDADGSFGTGASSLVATSFSNSIVTFTGIDQNLLNDGVYFTLGCVLGSGGKIAPGGVTGDDLTLWLKADTGTSTTTDGGLVTSWNDLSGHGNDASDTHRAPAYRDNPNDNINFNPTIDFDGSNDRLITSLNDLEGSSDYSLFAISIREDRFYNPIIGSDLPNSLFGFGYPSSTSFTFLVRPSSPQFSNATTFAFNDPALTPAITSGINDTSRLERNGNTKTHLNVNNDVFPNGNTYFIGQYDANYFKGRISEIIAFKKALNATEEQKVMSYLAIKYGLSLGQNENRQDYLDSAGTVIWDASAIGTVFDEDITAIGQDDKSGLNQTQSRSENTDTMVSIAENGAGMTDGKFLFWSNNGASVSFTTVDTPADIDQRLVREWRVAETGEVGSIDVSFDLSGVSIPSEVRVAGEFFLLCDDNGAFASGATSIVASTFNNNVVTFSGIDENLLDDNRFFTLGIRDRSGPAGYVSGIELWLKADAGVFVDGGTTAAANGQKVQEWQDQSGNDNHVTQTSEALRPTLTTLGNTHDFNANPSLTFLNASLSRSTLLAPDSNGTVFAVVKTLNLNGDRTIIEFEGNRPEINLDSARPGYRITHLGSSPSFATHQTPILSTGVTYLTGAGWINGNNQNVFTRINGTQETVSNFDVNANVGARIEIGTNIGGGDPLLGELAELIVYSNTISDPSELNRIESYLALKYGITLDQASPQNYVNSAGNVIWDATEVGPIFDNDIAGIGQDTDSLLDQTQSISVNADTIVTISENGGGIADGEFLLWANNDGSTTFNTDDIPAGIDYRLPREWVLKETGEVGSVDVSFNISGLTFPDGAPFLADLFLLTDADGTFSSESASLAASSLSNQVVTFTGVSESTFEDGIFFTLGYVAPPAPGGLNANMALWLKGGSGAFNDAGSTLATGGQAVIEWHDQSGHHHDFMETSAGREPTLVDASTNPAFNYNASLKFNADRLFRANLLNAPDDATIYAVVRSDNLGNANTILMFGSDDPSMAIAPTGPNLQFKMDASTPRLANHATSLTTGVTYLTGAHFSNGLNQTIDLRLDGVTTQVSNYDINANLSAVPFIGSHPNFIDSLIGDIAELIVFDRRITDPGELDRLESYLAVKYGISLDQSTSRDYVASDGTVIWDASVVGASYGEDITGIGQDDASQLDQKKSKSVNPDTIVTIAENGNGIDDRDFLFWSNNGGAFTLNTTDVPVGIDYRLPRQWIIEETGEVGAVDVAFTLTGLTFPDGIPALSNLFLLTDANGTFSSGSTSLAASSLSNNIVTFTGVSESTLEDGVCFTLGVVKKEGPGGIARDLQLWLKADAGTSTTTDGSALTTWSDQSGHHRDASENSFSPIFRNNTTDNLNFNPTVEFNDGTAHLDLTLDALEGTDGFTYFAVGERTDNGNNPVLGSNQGRLDYYFGFATDRHASFTIARSGINPIVGVPAHDDPAISPYLLMGYNDTVQQDRDSATITTTGNNTAMKNGSFYYIGRGDNASNFYKGTISEVIIFDTPLGSTDRTKVMSYLAVKYGLTLGQNIAAQDYLSSGGTVIWDASTVGTIYDEDIAAIGQDDFSGLNQQQSKSSNPDAILTITENGNGMTDGEFLFWSNNGGATSFSTSDLPADIDQRLSREWIIEETGEVGTVDLSFDLTGISLPAGVSLAGEFFLLTDADGTFASGTTRLAASSFSNSIVTFTGVNEDILDDGLYFTLGINDRDGPAGVVPGIQLWLKADAGTSTTTDGATLTSWTDQSGKDNHATESSNPPLFKNNLTDNLNFNPVVKFDGIDDRLICTLNNMVGASTFSFIAVTQRQDASINPIIANPNRTFLGPSPNKFGFGYFGFINKAIIGNALDNGPSIKAHDDPQITPSIFLASESFQVHEWEDRTDSISSVSVGSLNNLADHHIGQSDTSFFNGEIAEVIAFNVDLSAIQRARILSYLAIKYGISLGQNSSAQNYVNSDGTVIWDAAGVGSAYDEDIAAIGQDNNSSLNQTQSRSSSSDAIVTVADNGNGMDDGEFFFWSNNGLDQSFTANDLPFEIEHRLTRIWIVEETGEVGSINLVFDLNGIPLPAGADAATDFFLLTDADATFAAGASKHAATGFTNSRVTFTGIDENTLDDGIYFTLGVLHKRPHKSADQTKDPRPLLKPRTPLQVPRMIRLCASPEPAPSRFSYQISLRMTRIQRAKRSAW